MGARFRGVSREEIGRFSSRLIFRRCLTSRNAFLSRFLIPGSFIIGRIGKKERLMIHLGTKLRRSTAAADNGPLAKSDDLSDTRVKEWHYARIPR